jgi:flagellar motility protein MotE (MotC chaperone)
METDKIAKLLQTYFNGESSVEEERTLENYFRSGNVAAEFQEYAPFFTGISELANVAGDQNIEEEIMDFILEKENSEKTRYRRMWQTVTGIAASVIIVLGGFLFYQQQQKPFDDTFTNPDEAYAYAQQTLQFVSGKYNKGLAGLSGFDKLEKAAQPIKRATAPVNEFYNTIERLEKNQVEELPEINDEKKKSTDSI